MNAEVKTRKARKTSQLGRSIKAKGKAFLEVLVEIILFPFRIIAKFFVTILEIIGDILT